MIFPSVTGKLTAHGIREVKPCWPHIGTPLYGDLCLIIYWTMSININIINNHHHRHHRHHHCQTTSLRIHSSTAGLSAVLGYCVIVIFLLLSLPKQQQFLLSESVVSVTEPLLFHWHRLQAVFSLPRGWDATFPGLRVHGHTHSPHSPSLLCPRESTLRSDTHMASRILATTQRALYDTCLFIFCIFSCFGVWPGSSWRLPPRDNPWREKRTCLLGRLSYVNQPIQGQYPNHLLCQALTLQTVICLP